MYENKNYVHDLLITFLAHFKQGFFLQPTDGGAWIHTRDAWLPVSVRTPPEACSPVVPPIDSLTGVHI